MLALLICFAHSAPASVLLCIAPEGVPSSLARPVNAPSTVLAGLQVGEILEIRKWLYSTRVPLVSHRQPLPTSSHVPSS